jgi:hypothetical protein
MANQLVKDEIDAQSGRLEFLKQALTLGLAGLAGTAAFFTEPSKIPTDAWSIGAIVIMGLALLSTVGASLMGLSVYANLLKAHASREPADAFRTSIIQHAKHVFVTISLTAIAFATYAALQLSHRNRPMITSVEALGIARTAIGVSGCDATFETLSYRGGSVILTFQSQACQRRYSAEIQRDGGEVLSISSAPSPPIVRPTAAAPENRSGPNPPATGE